MAGRVLLFMGLPLLAGLATSPLFYYLKKIRGLDIPLAAVYGASTFFFIAAAAGITYGITSASWDPARPGSALGWTEFRANLPVLIERIRRGRS